jgi:hypothetical protein
MINANDYLTSQAMVRAAGQWADTEQDLLRSAVALYDRACTASRLHGLWCLLTRRANQLLDLSQVEASCTIGARCYAGIETVPLRQIRGSACRSHDFDNRFRPRRSHTKSRWLTIAVARRMGTILPPVELVRTGDVYFVQDGHHRISVARALGQACIEAEVVDWQVAGPLPWHTPTTARRRLRQPRRVIEPAGTG